METVATVLVVVHASVGALWLGAMAYSLFLVQPRLARLAGDDPAHIEELQRELAQGNRWPVVGMIALLWITGAVLVPLTEPRWPLLVVKAGALAAATIAFWWVSWRGWPRRIFALPEELPGLQRRFRRAAELMFALVAVAFVAGVALR